MSDKFYCMTMRMNIDCNGCYHKIRRALLEMHGKKKESASVISAILTLTDLLFCFVCKMEDIESHLVERKQQRVSVSGAFVPQDVAIKLRKRTNRRVEILELKEVDGAHRP
uniref:Uncharacterized protein n=1 Tax=Avena sativa TaxID=4498 RepID=A0ACD5ZYS7_AVESA